MEQAEKRIPKKRELYENEITAEEINERIPANNVKLYVEMADNSITNVNGDEVDPVRKQRLSILNPEMEKAIVMNNPKRPSKIIDTGEIDAQFTGIAINNVGESVISGFIDLNVVDFEEITGITPGHMSEVSSFGRFFDTKEKITQTIKDAKPKDREAVSKKGKIELGELFIRKSDFLKVARFVRGLNINEIKNSEYRKEMIKETEKRQFDNMFKTTSLRQKDMVPKREI